jgi:hypothetical protein
MAESLSNMFDKKSLTLPQAANIIPARYHYNKAIVGFAETLISEKIYYEELQWLLLS